MDRRPSQNGSCLAYEQPDGDNHTGNDGPIQAVERANLIRVLTPCLPEQKGLQAKKL